MQSKASKEFILAARLHRCKAGLDTAPIPRTPGSVMDEDESMGTLLARFDETSPFYS